MILSPAEKFLFRKGSKKDSFHGNSASWRKMAIMALDNQSSIKEQCEAWCWNPQWIRLCLQAMSCVVSPVSTVPIGEERSAIQIQTATVHNYNEPGHNLVCLKLYMGELVSSVDKIEKFDNSRWRLWCIHSWIWQQTRSNAAAYRRSFASCCHTTRWKRWVFLLICSLCLLALHWPFICKGRKNILSMQTFTFWFTVCW